MATLTRALELLLIVITFGATAAAVTLGLLSVLRDSWRSPIPFRRFLPLLWFLGLGFSGWLSRAWALPLLAGALVFIVVGYPIRWVLIPLGWSRATYVLARLAGDRGAPRDPRLLPALLAARAHGRRPSPLAQQFIAERLRRCGDLGPVGVAAAAALARSRGDTATGESMLRGVFSGMDAELDTLLLPELHELSVHEQSPVEPSASAPAPVEPSLAALAALASRVPGRARAEDVAAAIGSLDALRVSTAWSERLEARAAALGVNETATATMARILDDAEADLAEAFIDERWPLAWLGEGVIANAVRARVREQRLATVERLAAELQRRAAEGRDLPEAEEWQAWGELVRVSQQLEQDATTLDDRQLHFRAVHRPIWSYGYRQAFVLGRRSLGAVVFLLQRRLAYAAQAAEAYGVIEDNVRATRAIASPAEQGSGALWFCSSELVAAGHRFTVTVRLLALAGGLAGIAAFGTSRVGSAPLMAALVLTAFQWRTLRLPLIVEVLSHEERIAVQTKDLRWLVAPDEIELLPALGRLSRVRLARSPSWLAPLLFTVHASREAAERDRLALAQRRKTDDHEPGLVGSAASG